MSKKQRVQGRHQAPVANGVVLMGCMCDGGYVLETSISRKRQNQAQHVHEGLHTFLGLRLTRNTALAMPLSVRHDGF
ncbi:hypothetical protein BCR44DRAFT_200221 [Catenaria anguillulae PL171]|uniref:Uncharacterized protein n=1 Tax=Catenaria anguillulae PL171 TaxID=765915 RepID=A0A1Y2I3U4_9FUNG|nr:hypothetical protein BCR44DRAFT_200221 [Catenaria anguillulae PL171]